MNLLLEWALTSSVLIVVVLALRVLLRGRVSLRLQYAMWAAVLARLLFPFQLPLPAPVSASELAPQVSGLDQPSIPVLPVIWSLEEIQDGQAPDVWMGSGGELETANSGGMVQPVGEDQAAYALLWLSPEQVVLILWGAGAAITALVLLGANLRFSIRLRRSRRAFPIQNAAVPAYITECICSPCLFGLFRPAVYLTPESAADEQVRRHVLAHELTHFAHRDHIWAVLRCLALVLHWYNPLVWLAVVLSRRDGELACDEGAVARLGEGERISYGRTLVDMVARRSLRPGDLLCCSTTMTGGKKTIQERIALLVKRPETRKTALFAAVSALALAAVFVFAGGRLSDQAPVQEDWLDFRHQAESAQSIRLSEPLTSSTLYPDPITDPELLAQARSWLESASDFMGVNKGKDWKDEVLSAYTLTLSDGSDHHYYLSPQPRGPEEFDTYVLVPADLAAEQYTPIAVLDGSPRILTGLMERQQTLNLEQAEQTPGFSAEGLTFPSTGTDFDQAAQDFGTALAQAYLDLPVDDPGACVFAQMESWEVTDAIPGDDSRFCVRLSLLLQPLSPNTAYWMSGSGLDLTGDGRWMHTLEYRLERVEGDTWACTSAGHAVRLSGDWQAETLRSALSGCTAIRFDDSAAPDFFAPYITDSDLLEQAAALLMSEDALSGTVQSGSSYQGAAVTIAGEDGLRLSDFFVTGQTVCEALHDLSMEQARRNGDLTSWEEVLAVLDGADTLLYSGDGTTRQLSEPDLVRELAGLLSQERQAYTGQTDGSFYGGRSFTFTGRDGGRAALLVNSGAGGTLVSILPAAAEEWYTLRPVWVLPEGTLDQAEELIRQQPGTGDLTA